MGQKQLQNLVLFFFCSILGLRWGLLLRYASVFFFSKFDVTMETYAIYMNKSEKKFTLMFHFIFQLSVERLSSMKKYVFGLGSAQVIIKLQFCHYALLFCEQTLFLATDLQVGDLNVFAGFGDSSGGWLVYSLCLRTSWSCCNCHWKWLGFIINCSCLAGIA